MYPTPGGQGYPPQQGGYPPQSGVPYPQQNSGIGFQGNPGNSPYPSQGGPPYPGGGAPGYPSNPGYPSQINPGYPQQSNTGYPQSNPGYPSQPQAPSYPQQQPSYPNLNQTPVGGAYPGAQQQNYPPQQPLYPQQQQPSYSPQNQSYPSQQPTYPPQGQGQGYPGAQGPRGYPTQQPGGGNVPYNPGQAPYASAPGVPQGQGYPAQPQGYPNQQQQKTMQQTQGGGSMPNHSYSNPSQGTVKPFPSFNPLDDAQILRKAMKGFGCDDKAVINILCFRSNAQRQQIRNAFKTAYGKDLMKDLIDELKGNLEDCIIALMTPTADFDAMQLRKAMEGLGTKESWLIEIMCSRTNAQIHAIKEAYKRLYKRDLEADLSSETSGHFKRLLVSMSVGGRDETNNVNSQRAAQDAQSLYKAGEKKIGTDESTFNMVMASQNFSQLQAIFDEYKKISKHDIEKAIQSEFSGDIEDGLLAVVKCAKNRPMFFAERLYNSMKGMGTNDDTLIRCVVTRCEIDMVQIKQAFQKLYGKTLESFIAGDCSGKYKDALIALVKGM